VDRNIDWDRIARYYDAYVRTLADVPYFLDRARTASGPALELMCGTGRITLPLAEAGVELTAVDSSPQMLELLRRKLAGKAVRVRVVEADARTLRLNQRFGLGFVGFNALAEVLDARERGEVFAVARRHLQPAGSFIVTLHNPPVRRAQLHPEWRAMADVPLGSGHRLVVSSRWEPRSELRSGGEARGTRVVGVQRYEEREPSGRLGERMEVPIAFDLVEEAEIRGHAEAAGFVVEALRGDYDGSPFEPSRSPFMIFELRAL